MSMLLKLTYWLIDIVSKFWFEIFFFFCLWSYLCLWFMLFYAPGRNVNWEDHLVNPRAIFGFWVHWVCISNVPSVKTQSCLWAGIILTHILWFSIVIDRASLIAQSVKNVPAMQETWVRFLGREEPLEKEMATHSSILAWKIPWTEEPGGLQYMGSQESDMT